MKAVTVPTEGLFVQRTHKALAVAIVLLVVMGLGVVLLRPAAGLRQDIRAQRDLIAQQLQVTRAQLVIQQKQRDLAERQLRVSEQTRDLAAGTLLEARALRALAEQTRDLARATSRSTRELVRLSERLLEVARILEAVARDTDRHAASLDHKTGPTAP